MVAELRREMVGGEAGLVQLDGIELVGSRPDTLIVFCYHHRQQCAGRHPALVAGPRAEVARLWQFTIDDDDPWPRDFMDSPQVLAALIGSAFDAAELDLVDATTLAEIGQPPNIFPRRH